MDFTEEEKEIQKQSIKEIKRRKKELIEKLITSKDPLRLGYVSIFMAGSPGAGKTEFSNRYMTDSISKADSKFIRYLSRRGVEIASAKSLFVRIDVDEIREFLSQYRKTDASKGTKGNAHVMQKAANIGLDILREHCFKNDIPFLNDGTFGNYDTMRSIVRRSLDDGREVWIFYIYLDPLAAWECTEAREYEEGRNILKEKFIDQFFLSRENVDKIKAEFGNKVKVHCVLRNKDGNPEKIRFNVQSIDKFIEEQYDKKLVNKYSREDLQKSISQI